MSRCSALFAPLPYTLIVEARRESLLKEFSEYLAKSSNSSFVTPCTSAKEKWGYFFHNVFKKKKDRAPKTVDHSSLSDARKLVQDICDKYGFQIDLDKKVYDMSVSEKQTLEIVKAIYRGADLLILDEPTAVLTPIEVEKLFKVMRNMVKDGKSIIIITHKLNEVMEISDRVAVLRKPTASCRASRWTSRRCASSSRTSAPRPSACSA